MSCLRLLDVSACPPDSRLSLPLSILKATFANDHIAAKEKQAIPPCCLGSCSSDTQ
jgi:hypothetical protein